MKQLGIFDIEDSYRSLDKHGDPLTKLESLIDWSSLLPIIEAIRYIPTSKGGRPGICPLKIVKSLLLQSLYNLSDEQCEYQINDRLSFKRFIGLSISEGSADAKTLWLYKERIKYKQLDDKIFSWFSNQIEKAGYKAEAGQIIDASFVPTHKPTDKQRKQLKEEVPLTNSQAIQIDREATFTKKGGKNYHGYKNHIQVDNKHKMIRKFSVTTASVHDSQELENILDETNNNCNSVWADSAYRSARIEEELKKKNKVSKIHERAYTNKPLSKDQKANNHIKSKTRVRVEHIFGHMVTAMEGVIIHTIGLARAKLKITFKNLAYNMQRFVLLKSRKLSA